MPRRSLLLVAALLVLIACGKDEPSRGGAVPSWATVSKEQLAEAERLKFPVAFENPIGMRFVLIPAGKFTMGSPPEEESRDETETAHEVTLTKPYYLQTTETTNRQYRRLKPQHDSGKVPEQYGGQSLNGDEQPACEVSWGDAMAFVKWLNEQNPGSAYRLPTEAEWERACRAGTSTAFWWGNSISTDQANYDGNYVYGGGRKGVDRRVTEPVGTLPVSPWGLYEVHGNVREWVSDWYDDGDYAPGAATDPQGPASGESHSERGGAYSDGVFLLRAAFRAGVQGEGETRTYIGFRVAADVPTK